MAESAAAQARNAAVLRGMMWMAAGGLALCTMNALMRVMTLQMDSLQAQFLRAFFGLVVMLPLLVRDGAGAYRPKNIRGQFWRGAMHAAALNLFFLALPHIPLADVTAIQFTTPIFVLFGAAMLLKEKVKTTEVVLLNMPFSVACDTLNGPNGSAAVREYSFVTTIALSTDNDVR